MRNGSILQSEKTLSKMNFSYHNISEVVSKKKKPLILGMHQVETNRDELQYLMNKYHMTGRNTSLIMPGLSQKDIHNVYFMFKRRN